MKQPMTYGSLFTGIGGFDLGFDRSDMRCVWQVERDRQCLELLAQKWPNVRHINDVVRARYATEQRFAGRMDTAALVRPDIICGGFPCQDLSVAGKRRGLAGSRSGLFWTMRRIIGILKPTWFVLENVPGLLSSNGGRDMGAVVGSLVDSGYGVAWRVLDSQFFGLAQRRKRVFLVGHLGDVRRAGAVLFDGESMSRNSPPSREAGEGVTYETSPSLRASGVGSERVGDTRGQDCVVAASLVSNGDAHSRFRDADGPVAMTLPASSGVVSSGMHPVVAMTLNAKNGKRYDAESETLLPFTFQPRFARNGRGGPSEAVDALTASESGTHGDSKPHVATRQGVRCLMPIECERLQGFPDNWTAGFSDSARYRMLGNAVSVPVIEWLAKRILQSQE